MRFHATPLPVVWIVDADVHLDDRGSFETHFSAAEFRERGLHDRFPLTCTSTNVRAGTLRGLHWQDEPHGEVKLVRCIRGAIFDVVVDLRRDSPTYLQWHAVELTETNRRLLYIPVGCAHGYQTLVADCWVAYQLSQPYHPASARGARWNDQRFRIEWPDCNHRTLSQKDASYADYRD
jgi:dTDP-4-dehydrorhamnose 3,5-epimerase